MAKEIKDYKELQPTIAERCAICNAIFAKKHPKECRCICHKCSDKLWQMMEERIKDNE